MASIYTTDSDVQLFTGLDPYRFDVDNRPLRRLIQNDINLNTELTATTGEVVSARRDTNLAVLYDTLEARLDAMSASGLSNSSVSYSIFQSMAERNRALYQSGFLTKPMTKQYNSNTSFSFSGDDFGGIFGSQYAGLDEPNTLFINTEYDGQFAPLSLLVNGWLVKLSWLNAGGLAGSASTSYPYCTVKLPNAPATGGREDFVFLEVWLKKIPASNPQFWLYGSPQYKAALYNEVPTICTSSDPTDGAYNVGNYTTNPLDPRVVHTLSRLNNGDWLQVQCRIRIVTSVNAALDDPFADTAVLAQGAQGAPVTGHNFANALQSKTDAGLWVSGAGSSDTGALGTYDGYSYAVPITFVHRRNQAAFSMQDQNGTKTTSSSSGYMSSGLSGRPDGRYYDGIVQDDYIDLRRWCDPNSVDFKRILEEAFDDIITGKSRLQWQQLTYPSGPQYVYGNRLLVADTIFDNIQYPIGSSAEMTNSNWVIDKSVDPAVAYSKPDGVRRHFSTSVTTQRVEFWVDPFAGTSEYDVIAPGFITVSGSGTTRTVNINPQVLSGTIGNVIQIARVPVWHWASDNTGISLTVAASTGLSYNYTFAVTGHSSEKVLCNVDISFPTQSGLASLPVEITRQDLFDGSSTISSYSTPINAYDVKTVGGSDAMWAPDFYAHSVYYYSGANPTIVPNATISAASVVGGAPNAPQYPISVAPYGDVLGGTGAIWVTNHYQQKICRYQYNPGTQLWTLTGTVSSPFSLTGGGSSTFGGAYLMIDVTTDGATLFVSDFNRHVVWKFNTSSLGTATALVGKINTPGINSTAGDIRLNYPLGIAVDADTSSGVKLWIADYANGRVLKVSTGVTPAVEVRMQDGDSRGGSLDPQITNSDQIIAVGTPGTANLYYLMSCGTSISGTDTNNRIVKMDENFNIIAQSAPYNRSGNFCVDDMDNPQYVYFMRGGSYGAFPEVRVLRFSDLATVADYGASYFGGPAIGNAYGVTYSPAIGSYSNPSLIINGQYGGRPRTIRMNVTGSGTVVSFAEVLIDVGVDPNTYGYSTLSPVRLRSGTYRFYQTVMNIFSSGGIGYVYEWTNTGTTWTRSASPIVTTSQVPIASDADAAGNIYVTFLFPVGFAGADTTGGNYVRRYTESGGIWSLSGTFGDGVASGSPTQIAAPCGVSVIKANGGASIVERVVVQANKNQAFGAPDPVYNRLVFFGTDDTSWGTNPYISDTNNLTATISVALVRPSSVSVANDTNDVYIVDLSQYAAFHLSRAISGSATSYQYVGKFGMIGEPGNDHGHLGGPFGIAAFESHRVAIADINAGRILKIHDKMAGVSLSSGNIETMTAMVKTDRLRIWSKDIAYMGVGSKVWGSANDVVFANQVLLSSDNLYVTTLGRGPLTTNTNGLSNTSFKGMITRLPFAMRPGATDDSAFQCENLTVAGMLQTSGLLKLPIMSHGLAASLNYSDIGSDGGFIAYIRSEPTLKAQALRGYPTTDGAASTMFASALSLDSTVMPPANRMVIRTFLIKQAGKVYLLVITRRLNFANFSNHVGEYDGGNVLHAVDLFEVPGRLLIK